MTHYTTIKGDILTTNSTGSHCYLAPNGGYGEGNHMRRISKAEFQRIIEEDKKDRNIEEATRETEESITTEEGLKVVAEIEAQEKPKKKAKKRTPKNIGFRNTYNNHEVILTEKQVDFIKHLPDTCYWEDGLDSAIWVDCLCDEIEGQFAGKPMTVGAMISTLCEKGLGKRGKDKVNGRKCTSFALTELGKLVAKDLGL
jgi:hypothetical protein